VEADEVDDLVGLLVVGFGGLYADPFGGLDERLGEPLEIGSALIQGVCLC
jgi:hypothetical protein